MKPRVKTAYMICAVLIFAVLMTGMARADDSSVNDAVVQISLVNQNPDPAKAGEIVELRFIVENVGGKDANNIVMELLPSYPFKKVDGEDYVKTVSILRGYQQGADAAIVKYKVMVDKDASKGTGKISLKHSAGVSSTYVIEDFDVDVTSKEFAQVIYIDKSIISPGNETNITFTVNNIGNSPLRNLVFSWNEPNGKILPVFSDDTKYVKYLDVGGSVNLDYRIVADVNTNPGLYLLNLNLKFDVPNGSSSEIKTKAGIFVGGETDFDVTYSESSSGQTSLSVANTGNNPAYSVTVRIPEQAGISVSSSSSSIVGNLDKGDYTIVSFQITSFGAAAAAAQGTRPSVQYGQGRANATGMAQRNVSSNLKVIVDYTDTTGKRHSVEKTVALQASSSLSSSSASSTQLQTGFRRQSDNSWLIITVVIIAAAVGGYFFYRRRKKSKKAQGSVSRHETHQGRKAGA